MRAFIGSDVSLKTSAICVLDERGKSLKEVEVASDPAAFVAFVRRLPWEIEAIGLKAGPLSQWLRRGIADAGIEAVLMETRQVKAVRNAMPVKTDRRDPVGAAMIVDVGDHGLNWRSSNAAAQYAPALRGPLAVAASA